MKYYKLSWIAYVKQVLVAIAVFCVLLILKSSIGNWAILLACLWLCWCTIGILENFIISVWIDDQGVWVRSGLFPWNRGVYGLNWRDISGATYQTGFINWLFQSHTVNVQHRYTKDSHLRIRTIFHGKQLALEINNNVAQKNLY